MMPVLMSRRSRLVALATLAALVLSAATFFVWRAARPKPFDPAASPVGAFVARALPLYLVMVDRWSRGAPVSDDALRATREAALPPAARAALGPEGTAAAMGLMEAMTEVARPGRVVEADVTVDAYVAAGERFNGALVRAGQPFLVDVEAGRQGGRVDALLYSFYVERERTAKIAGREERAAQLFRVDTLNLRQSYLGYTRPRSSAAMVLLDAIETELVVYVLPALADGEETELLDEASLDDKAPWQAALRAYAGALVRQHYRKKPGEPLAEVGRLLARRRALVRSWQRVATALGYRFHVPQRLVPEGDYHEALARRVPRKELFEWDELHDDLLSKKNLAAFLAARQAYAASVELHELTHRADYARGLVPVPPELCGLLGLENPLDAPAGSMAARLQDEYSAYLSQLAREDDPSLDLLLLSRFTFDKTQWGGVYTYASLAVLTQLARELGIDPPALIARGAVQRARAAELFTAVTKRPASELKAAAERAWQKAFGAALPVIEAGPVKDHTPYRP